MKKEKPPKMYCRAAWHRGALGGRAIGGRKAEAARANGKKGGRPRKTQAVGVAAIAPGNKPKLPSSIEWDPDQINPSNRDGRRGARL